MRHLLTKFNQTIQHGDPKSTRRTVVPRIIISGQNINNIWYEDDTGLTADTEKNTWFLWYGSKGKQGEKRNMNCETDRMYSPYQMDSSRWEVWFGDDTS